MGPLMIVLLCIAIVLIPIIVILVRKHKKGIAVILGFICAGLLACTLYLSIAGKPLDYVQNQTKENYLKMQDDRNISSFRVIVDGVITNNFPEWDDDNPYTYRLDYTSGQIFITTVHDEQ